MWRGYLVNMTGVMETNDPIHRPWLRRREVSGSFLGREGIIQ